tara:strand:- start:4318 stop:7539 length:3222 start_codon:yes stop_codon:yes gene_type:complete
MRTFIFLLCTTVFGFSTNNGLAQEKVNIEQDKIVSVDEVFEIIINQTKYSFLYPANLFKDTPKVKLKKGVLSVGKLLQQALPNGQFNIILGLQNRITIKKKNEVQQRQISGKITDSSGEPLPNVTVRVKGTNKATASDFNGVYKITISDNANVLVFTSIGFETQEIAAENQTTINVTLKEAVGQLDEIVINAGYYNTTQRESTGNIAKVDAKDIELQPLINPLQALQGRMAGVVITQPTSIPGASTNIQIRGQNSLRPDGNYPLYVIDGMPVISSPVSSSGLLGLGIDPLNSLNLSNIESIEILKDADATSIYGSRGANGVVLITTKKSSQGKTKMDIRMYSGIGKVSNKIDVLNTQQYITMRNEAFANDGIEPTTNNAPDLTVWDQQRYTDWQEVLLGNTSYINDTQLSFSGGSNRTTFLVGGAFHKETSVFPEDFGYKKFNANANINHYSADDKFHLNVSVNYGQDINDLFSSGAIIQSAVLLSPNAPALYNEQGELNWEEDTWTNPLSDLRKPQQVKSNFLITNASLSYKIWKGLSFKTNLGFTKLDSESIIKNPISASNPNYWVYGVNYSSFENTTRQSYIIEPQLLYKKKLGKLNLDVLTGITFQKSENNHTSGLGVGYTDENFIGNLAMADNVYIQQQEDIQYKYHAIFGRLSLNWDGKYLLNLTGRRDGSSRFAPGNRFANFGAVGAAWIFSEENFIEENLSFLSFGKLRASYGTTGSDQIADYGYFNAYEPSLGEGGLYPSQIGNPLYSWEINKKLEFSLSLGAWNDRMMLSSTWYRNRSSNQLVGYSLPAFTGFTSIQANMDATVENSGWEFELATNNINSENFSWNTSINLTIPKNKLIDFPNLEQSSYAYTYRIGSSLNSTFLYKSLGVNPETGLFEVEDVNGDGSYNIDDRTIIKEMEQKYFGGVQNNIRWKNFHINFFFEFVKQPGRNHLSWFQIPPGRLAAAGGNQPMEVMNRWQQPGDISDMLQFSTSNTYTSYNRVAASDLSLTDASYVRLKTLTLSYQLPASILKKIPLEQCQIYLHGQNLWTITDFKGKDPALRNGNLTSLPPLRTVSLGLQLTF